MADNKSIAYDSIIAKLKTKLARQEQTVAETKQHISAIEALRTNEGGRKSTAV